MARKSSEVSLREIAQETNLSITTISRVLREQGEISDKTRIRVLEAAKRLRYRPNMLVHGIRTGRTKTMGVIVPPYDSYWIKVLTGIHHELTESDYVHINAWCTEPNGEGSYDLALLQQLHRLIDRRVDGIILWAHLAPLYNEKVVEELEARELPVVTIDHELPFADSVETDEALGASLVAEHLLKLGHNNVAHLGWDNSYKWAQSRRVHFENQINQAGGTCTTMCAGNDNEVDEITQKLLSNDPMPTAIYACSDRVAQIIYARAKRMGLKIPDDLSVVGFADIEFAKWMHPALTTIRQDGMAAGKMAAKILIKKATEKSVKWEPERVTVSCELITRDSTGPVKVMK